MRRLLDTVTLGTSLQIINPDTSWPIDCYRDEILKKEATRFEDCNDKIPENLRFQVQSQDNEAKKFMIFDISTTSKTCHSLKVAKKY